jgi:hypothetical protein
LPLQRGDTFRSIGCTPRDKQHVNDVEVTHIESPRLLVLTSLDQGKRYVSRFDVQPGNGGSQITRTVDAPKPQGLLRLLFPVVFVLFIKPEVEKGMRMLQENVGELDELRQHGMA